MAVMMAKLYAALRAANVPDDAAREAAEEIASYENRFAKIEADLATFRVEVRGRFNLLSWMVGVNSAFVFAVFLIVPQMIG